MLQLLSPKLTLIIIDLCHVVRIEFTFSPTLLTLILIIYLYPLTILSDLVFFSLDLLGRVVR